MLRAAIVLEIAAHLNGAGITRAERVVFPDGSTIHLWAFEPAGQEQVFAILERDRAFLRWKILKEGFWTTVLQYQELAVVAQAPAPTETARLKAA